MQRYCFFLTYASVLAKIFHESEILGEFHSGGGTETELERYYNDITIVLQWYYTRRILVWGDREEEFLGNLEGGRRRIVGIKCGILG